MLEELELTEAPVDPEPEEDVLDPDDDAAFEAVDEDCPAPWEPDLELVELPLVEVPEFGIPGVVVAGEDEQPDAQMVPSKRAE